MKKCRITVLFALVALMVLSSALLTACGSKLTPPTEFSVDEDNVLSWSAVEEARYYTLEIKAVGGTEEPTEKKTSKTNYSLANLEVGDYEIRVKTIGADGEEESPWSEAYAFHRDFESGCVYELINGNTEYRLTRGIGATGVLTVEATYRGKPVTEIGVNAFMANRNITEVIVESGIRIVDESAFYNCSALTKVTLPDTVTTINARAFQGCSSLQEVVLPSNLEVIPDYCFIYCRNLTNVNIGEQVKTIGESAFQGTAIAEVVIPDSVTSIALEAFADMDDLTTITIGAGVTTIGSSAISANAKLETVIFAPESALTTIGSSAFSQNSALKSLVLPEGVTQIGARCFYQCTELESVTLPSSITRIGNYAFHATKIYIESPTEYVYAGNWLVAVKDLSTLERLEKTTLQEGTVGICEYCFMNAPVLVSVTLPDSVVYVGAYAFAYNYALNRFESGSGLRILGTAALAQNPNLYRVSLKRGLEEIGAYAFYECSMLENPVDNISTLVPDTVKKIGNSAFMYSKLWNAPDEYGVVYAGNWAVGFQLLSTGGTTIMGSVEVELRDTVVGISDYAFSGADISSITNLSYARYIGTGAFFDCSALNNVVLNPNIRVIENYTFSGCTNLYRIVFPEELRSVGAFAFYKCTMISSLDFTVAESGFESIGAYAFYGCSNLQKLQLGTSVKSIGAYAFYRCPVLVGEPESQENPESFVLRIPGSVETISSHAFARCSGATALELGEGITEIGLSAFYKCTGLQTVVLPDTVTAIRNSAFYSCLNIRYLTLGNGVETIEKYAFYNLKLLRHLQLPSSLKVIARYAFKSCELLTGVTLPKNITEIEAYAFYGCHRATFYVEDGAQMTGWNARWNASFRPVVYNVTLSETGDYIVSVTVGENGVENTVNLTDTIMGIRAPRRAGYTFAAWQVEGSDTIYSARDIVNVPAGTTLIAVWNEGDPEPEPEPEIETETEPSVQPPSGTVTEPGGLIITPF